MPPETSPEDAADPFGREDDGAAAPIRDRVTFRAAIADVLIGPVDAAADFVSHVKMGNAGRSAPIRVRPHLSYSGAVTVRVYWRGGRFHTLKISSTPEGCLLASHNVGGALSLLLHEWLTASDRFTDIRWRTRDQSKNGGPSCETPT